MIKLNNKNITYVALADSNNSLKAPKEIWYADSNNSVKLVYRRKDALIEGEDYEKYHWLCSDTAYIDTNIISQFEDELYAIVTALGTPSVKNIGFITAADDSNNITISTGGDWMSNGTPQLIAVTRPFVDTFTVWNANVLGSTIKEYYIYSKIKNGLPPECYVIANGENCGKGEVSGNNTITSVPSSTYKIAYYINLSRQITLGLDVIKLRNVGINNHSFIPCKLLKPVPKWLDANGIRRQVGECGMIDLVSGKFYGNVNSVGTFTVENYYERKEWLIIPYTQNDANSLPIQSNNFSFKYILYTAANVGGIWTTGMGYAYAPNYTKTKIYSSTQLTMVYEGNSFELNEEYVVNCSDGIIVMNGETMPNYGSSPYFNNLMIYCYTSAGKYALSSVTIDGSVRYIPCTLTMDLPASMDANNIARTKGTSGMWDLVSDKFYGNVANSGTFKAVNLAEGVDYEVHQWLRIDVNTMQVMQMMSLPINSYQFSFKRKWLRQSTYSIHSSYFEVEGYSYFTNQNIKMLIWDGANATHIYNSETKFNLGDTITINCNAENYNFDGVSMPIYGVCKSIPLDCAVDNPNVGADIAFSTSSITVDGIERYIPVKLIHSIPSKYDANGIARQAGECGMYDTVNDVFYGNVASSGSFTVEDDN